MDAKAVKRAELMDNDTYFYLTAFKHDGEKRVRYYRKLNHALRALYRIGNIKSGSVKMKMPGGPMKSLFARHSKNGRKSARGVNITIMESREGRELYKPMESRNWHQLPRANINEIV